MTQYCPIKLIRMMSGEVIITGIVNGGKESYIFEKPMLLMAVARPNQSSNLPQEVTILLRDWMEFSNDVYYIIPKNAVMCIMKPNRDIVADYTQAKIQSDIMGEMIENGKTINGNKTVDDLEMEPDNNEDDTEFEGDHEEFPGWGGDPRFG